MPETQPIARPADAPNGSFYRQGDAARNSVVGLVAWAAVIAMIAGCVSIEFRTTGAVSLDDFEAESRYIAIYTDHVTALHRDLRLFAPSGTNPGVCNKGGDVQACFDADAKAIADLSTMLEALKATSAPPRYVEADRLLRQAAATMIQGLNLRNRALANGDNSLWQQHGPLLESAQADFAAAYRAFPPDHRPALVP
jgi:hypothetical protein